VHALALGRGRPVGPEGQEELDSGKGFRTQDLASNAVGSLLLLAYNYNHTTNDFTTRGTERTEDAQRLLKTIPGSLQRRYPCGAVGSSARLPLDCGCPASRAALLAAACGPSNAALSSGRFCMHVLASDRWLDVLDSHLSRISFYLLHFYPDICFIFCPYRLNT
jgi:hypothetical protein